ncbi:MAG: hypothetical protein MZU97_18985 [Bacillus subtilis]|nr:hypothetical protein [Bacillus subtilis]
MERDRAHIENVIIKGNKKTKDHVIYRETALRGGRHLLQDQGHHGAAQPLQPAVLLRPYAGDDPRQRGKPDGHRNHRRGASSADIQFGLTLSGIGQSTPGFPISGLIKWNDRNFLGNGQSISVGLTASPDSQR